MLLNNLLLDSTKAGCKRNVYSEFLLLYPQKDSHCVQLETLVAA